jgi:hypothetical protein
MPDLTLPGKRRNEVFSRDKNNRYLFTKTLIINVLSVRMLGM